MLTPEEAGRLALKHRHVAEALDRLAVVQKWRAQCKSENAGHDTRVSWGLGTAVPGYEDIAKAVSQLVAPMIPDLIDRAIRQAETDLHIARRDLPKTDWDEPAQ